MFRHAHGGFDGPHVRRVHPRFESYVRIDPHASITRDIDISDAYGLVEPGDYQVGLVLHIQDVFAEGEAQHQFAIVKSPTASSTIALASIRKAVTIQTQAEGATGMKQRTPTTAALPSGIVQSHVRCGNSSFSSAGSSCGRLRR